MPLVWPEGKRPVFVGAGETLNRRYSGRTVASLANEAALKLARRWHRDRGDDRYEIVAFNGSFHGRTIRRMARPFSFLYHAKLRARV